MIEYLLGGFILGIFAGMAIVNTWNYFWETHGERPFASDNLRFVIANAEVANLNADLQIENIRLRKIETESAAVIAMARSFANFPSWLENLEAALASDDLSQLTTQQKPDMESMLRASPSCGIDGCLWEREEIPSSIEPTNAP